MKKLSIILLYSLLSLVIFKLVYVVVFEHYHSLYDENTIEISGVIKEIKYYDSSIRFIVNAKEDILVVSYDKIPDIKLGEQVIVHGSMKIPKENTVFNLFNYRKYLLSKRIYYIFQLDEIEVTEKENFFYKIKNKFIDNLRKTDNEYLMLMVLGINNLSEESNEIYRTNGINHLFCISGMHITMISGALLLILNKICKHKRFNYILVFFILLYYGFLVGNSASIIRSILMYLGININKIFNLRIKSIYILTLICLTLLLYNPFYIYDIGFLYSFTITFSLIYFNNLTKKSKNYFIKSMIISLLAFIVSFPITINNNFSINIISPLLNIIFVPLVTFIVFPLALLTFFIPKLIVVFSLSTNILESLAIFGYKYRLELIFSYIPLYGIFIYYITIFWFLKRPNIKKFVILLLILFMHYNIKNLKFSPYLTMIDVGQGDSFLIELENNKGNILIDTGGNINYSLGKNIIVPYLKSRGIKKLDYLIITHGDFDHIGSATDIISNIKVEKIILNSESDTEEEKEIISLAKAKDINIFKFSRNVLYMSNTKFMFLNKISKEENKDGLIIYTELNGYKLIFMADTGFDEEKALMRDFDINDIDILKIGHHGSKYSTSEEFIGSINPKIALISVGANNHYGHPSTRVMELLEDRNIETYVSSIDNSVLFKLKKNMNIYTCKWRR